MPDPNESIPKHLPRILAKADAAAYCGLTEPGFDTWVKTGKLPRAMKGTRRWDIVALDQAIDRLSGVSRDAPPPKPSGLAKFIAERDAKKAAAAVQAEKERKAVAEGLRKAAAIKPGAGRRGRPIK